MKTLAKATILPDQVRSSSNSIIGPSSTIRSPTITEAMTTGPTTQNKGSDSAGSLGPPQMIRVRIIGIPAADSEEAATADTDKPLRRSREMGFALGAARCQNAIFAMGDYI